MVGGTPHLFVAMIVHFIYFYRCFQAENRDLQFFVDEIMHRYENCSAAVPGASVLVLHQANVILHRSYGNGNVEVPGRVTLATNFRLASLTKQFTAAAIFLLIQDEKINLNLDDPIRRRWFPQLPEVTENITVRHLLTHTSGLIDYEELTSSYPSATPQLSDHDVLNILSTTNRTYFSPPGLRYRYSNSGYALLALVVERASSKTFATFLRDNLFRPLNMNNTVAYETGVSTVSNRAYGYSFINGTWMRTDQSFTSAVLGDGGIYSSTADFIRWIEALEDQRLFTADTLSLFFTPAVETDDPAIHYGMGWRISGDLVWHSGETIGFRNVIVRFPKQRLTVVILTNRNSPGPYQAALNIAHRFLLSGDDGCSSSSTTITRSAVHRWIGYICLTLLMISSHISLSLFPVLSLNS